MIIPNRKIPLLILLAAALIVGIGYIVFIPPWQSPDEPTHFEYAGSLAAGSKFWAPASDPALQKKIILSMDRNEYWRWVGEERPFPLPATFKNTPFLEAAPSQIGKNPPLYYLIASLALRILPPRSVEGGLYRLRALSLLFTLLTVGFVWAAAREIFGGDSLLVPAAAGVTAFLPQFMVIGTSVSPDPLINLLGAIVICLVLRFQREGFAFLRVLILIFFFGIGLLAGYKFLILLAALPGVMLIHLIFHRRRLTSRKRQVLALPAILAIFLLGYSSLIWYFPEIGRIFIVRLNILYGTISSFVGGETGFSPDYWGWFNSELFKSFWLKFGWMKFELPAVYYSVFRFAVGVALVGLLSFLIRWRAGITPARREEREAIVTMIIYAAVSLGAYYLFWSLRPGSTSTQGRHLFLVMPAWVILFIYGWTRLFPPRWEKGVAYVLPAGMAVINIISLFGYIIPTFS